MTRGPDLPFPAAGGGEALVNNRIHWFDGVDAKAQWDVDWYFVHDLGEPFAGWQNTKSVARMLEARTHFSTAFVDGLIYLSLVTGFVRHVML